MIFEKFRKIVADQLDVDESKITLDADIVKDIGADSLDIVEILMEVESVWGVTIDDDIALSFKTVKDVVDYIEKAVG